MKKNPDTELERKYDVLMDDNFDARHVLDAFFPGEENIRNFAACLLNVVRENNRIISESISSDEQTISFLDSIASRTKNTLAFQKKAFMEAHVAGLQMGMKLGPIANGKKGAAEKLANDPKQYAKEQIYKAWIEWREGRAQYGKRNSQAAFASAMREKWDVIENVRSIENWCRDWKNGKNIPLIEPA